MGPLPAVALLAIALDGSEGACAPARQQYEALSLEEALQTAEHGLEEEGGRPLPCVEIRALVLTVLGRLDEARAAWGELFERAPDYRVADPSLSPAQRETIERIRESVRPMEAEVRARWLDHDALRVDVLLSGGLRDARRVRLQVQEKPGEPAPLQAEVPLAGRAATATIAVPVGWSGGPIAVQGRVLSAVDRVQHQFSSQILLAERPQPKEAVVVESPSWPWWLGIGAGVIGAAVVITVLSQPDKPPCVGEGCVDVSR